MTDLPAASLTAPVKIVADHSRVLDVPEVQVAHAWPWVAKSLSRVPVHFL
jgi:hypothetical protein